MEEMIKMKRSRSNKSSITPSRFNYRFNIRNYLNYTRFLIIMTTILFTIGGTYYAFFYTPRYQASVYLSSQVYGSLSAAALSKDKAIPLDDKETSAPRQLELLQTPQILTELVKTLDLDLTVEGKLADQFVISELTLSRSLYNETILITTIDDLTYRVDIPAANFEAEGTLKYPEVFAVDNENMLQIQLDAIPQIPGAELTLVKRPIGETIDEILANSLFEAPGVDDKLVTNLIRVSYTGMNPQKIAKIVNTLADLAVQNSKFEEKREAFQTLELMNLERAQVLSFLNLTGQKLAELNRGLRRVSINEEIDSKLAADQMIEVEKNLVKAKAELSALKKQSTDQNPKIQASLAGIESLIAEREEIHRKATSSLQVGDELLDLHRDLLVYTNLYQEICRSLQQFQARAESPVGNLTVLEYAQAPDTPVSYSRPVIILLSALIGMICGYILALVLD